MYPRAVAFGRDLLRRQIEIEARLHHGGGRGGEVGAGESLQVFGALIVGAHLDDRKCEQPRREHVQRDRDVAEAELLGDNRAGYRRAGVAAAAEFLRDGAAHESELPCLGDQRGGNRAAFVGGPRRGTNLLAREGTDAVADHLLFFTEFKIDHKEGLSPVQFK